MGDAIKGIGKVVKGNDSESSPMRRRAMTIKSLLDVDSPIMRKQIEINKPRRRTGVARSKLQFQQFV